MHNKFEIKDTGRPRQVIEVKHGGQQKPAAPPPPPRSALPKGRNGAFGNANSNGRDPYEGPSAKDRKKEERKRRRDALRRERNRTTFAWTQESTEET